MGDDGGPVADLQRRLLQLELPSAPDHEGVFGPGTRAAVEAFQHRRGLRVDGRCGPQTWSALVEAGWRLGERFLYHRSPMLRGDDVADLQRRLSALGFDTGRVDGIFGHQTAAALAEFQRNTGLPVDAILGASTYRELRRVMPRHGVAELVSAVRDRERMRHAPRTLLGRRIAIGEEGGLDPLVAALRRRLTGEGAQVVPVLHREGSVQAELANTAAVEVYLGLRLDPEGSRCRSAYYSGFQYESPGGRRLAELVQALAASALGLAPEGAQGMALAVLRETRMPAVVFEVGPPALVVQRSAALADALVQALAAWVVTPVD
ncbi:MAG TPA: peptidoglycan-binding protein [Acidimicrobiales bacterium]|nr:peptidoglycan-binding protein [Acidimicrobiales bacterium]